MPFVNCCQFMYLVLSLLVLKAEYWIWLYQFLIIAYHFYFFLFLYWVQRYCEANGWTSISVGIAFKILREYLLTIQTAFWPIRTKLSVPGNLYQKSIYEPKIFHIFKNRKKWAPFSPFTHPSISYRNYILHDTRRDIISLLLLRSPEQQRKMLSRYN